MIKIGLLVVLVGVAVAVGVIVNDSVSIRGYNTIKGVSPKSYGGIVEYPVKRTVRVIVESSLDFQGQLYILDQTGLKLWLQEGVFSPLKTVDIYGGVSTTFEPPMRGLYGFALFNNSNKQHDISLVLVQYGLEYDLLTMSGALIISGAGLAWIGALKKIGSKIRGVRSIQF